jgi:hypothetical protein
MRITFQKAMEKISTGIILACPVCFDGLEIDEERQGMHCPKHGNFVPFLPNTPKNESEQDDDDPPQ